MSVPAEQDTHTVTGRGVLAVVGLWLGSAALLATAGYLAVASVTDDAEAPTLTAVLLAYLCLPLAALTLYRPGGLKERLAVRGVGWHGIGLGVLAWLVTLAATATIYLLAGAATGRTTSPGLDVVHYATDFARFPTATALDWALIVPRAFLLAGIAEELLFRGILYGWLRRHLSPWATIAITAGLFAIEHGYYPILLPVALLFGLTAGWLRHRTGSILPGLVMHILTDAFLFTLAVIASAPAAS